MNSPKFVQGKDTTTFAPFELIDARETKFKDVRLQFNNWRWLEETHGTEYIDGYYLNGGGIQGLVMAARVNAGLDACPPGMVPNSEGDTCYMHFPDLHTAVETATLAQQMIIDRATMAQMVVIAREQELDD